MTKKEMDLHQQNRFSIKINKILQDKKDNQQFLTSESAWLISKPFPLYI